MTTKQQRLELANAARMAYTSAFPGSAAWNWMQKANKALAAFDAANPSILAELNAAADARRAAEHAYQQGPAGRQQAASM